VRVRAPAGIAETTTAASSRTTTGSARRTGIEGRDTAGHHAPRVGGLGHQVRGRRRYGTPHRACGPSARARGAGADDADLGDGLRLEPSPGHTPGHVSLWIGSAGARALVTGDFVHHPVQSAEPDWAEVGDADVEVARATRHRMVRVAAESGPLVIGTHFPNRPAGRVVADGERFRFVPVPT
jgi:glyoxylase-like metal-dependent hydrolase (beta-lactamase superfamily II)